MSTKKFRKTENRACGTESGTSLVSRYKKKTWAISDKNTYHALMK